MKIFGRSTAPPFACEGGRATAFRKGFFAFGKTTLPPLSALGGVPRASAERLASLASPLTPLLKKGGIKLRLITAILLCTFAAWQFSGAAWIETKARFGQFLLERAWSQVRQGDESARPWPWAETSPVARLHVPGLEIRQLVLGGDDGNTLAWGPGLVSGHDVWWEAGNTMISAHRDTHFRFLKDLETGQQVWLETPHGDMSKWRVDKTRVVDSRDTAPDLSAPGPLLTLVTCYPFDAVEAGGPLRYVVSLSPMEEPV